MRKLCKSILFVCALPFTAIAMGLLYVVFSLTHNRVVALQEAIASIARDSYEQVDLRTGSLAGWTGRMVLSGQDEDSITAWTDEEDVELPRLAFTARKAIGKVFQEHAHDAGRWRWMFVAIAINGMVWEDVAPRAHHSAHAKLQAKAAQRARNQRVAAAVAGGTQPAATP